MRYTRLAHKNPKLNEKTMWYRFLEHTSNGAWYLCTIWGPQGLISSVVHAVPCEDYILNDCKEPETVPVREDASDEFI